MFYNCHIHIFQDIDVPRRFLPLALIRFLAKKPVFSFVARTLQYINPFSDSDIFDRYAKFLTIGKLGSQQKIFEECCRFYPPSTQFLVLSMDMAFMNAGSIPNKYEDQLKELGELNKIYPQIIPFMCVDPRRSNNLELLKRCVEDWNFKGIKLYPLLGYFPYDERLYPIYDYCQNNNLQVITHCSPYNPVHYRGNKGEIGKLLENSKIPIDSKKYKKKELFAFFADPKNYTIVANDFKELKICISHFGSHVAWSEYLSNPGKPDNWFVQVKDMLEKYMNIYTDVSFTLNKREFFPLLKVILNDPEINDKILFGSDFYMVETETDERRFGLDLRAYLGEDIFQKIAVENPKKFLNSIN
jgi:uncharacterized protein